MISPAMRSAVVAAGVTIALAAGAWQQSEAPTGFDEQEAILEFLKSL